MLLDTSGLFCVHHVNEPQHQVALALFDSASYVLTHSYVLDELIALANTRRLPRLPVLAFAQSLLNYPLLEIVWVDAALHLALP